MAEHTFRQTVERIREHLVQHSLKQLRVVFHGGEPLLAGTETLAAMADRLREAVPLGVAVDTTVQTNGVRLGGPEIRLLAAHGIRVSVSLDGYRESNDLYRRYANGRGSFGAVDQALRLLQQHPKIFAGILCVVNVASDPVRTYEALVRYGPPTMDFLLPHGNWSSPPPDHSSEPRYGAWLAAVFDRWYGAPRHETRVRFLEEVINLLLGGNSRTEAIGRSPAATIVINVDGSYEDIDTLRSAYASAVDTGLNVFDHSMDEALQHPSVVARHRSETMLADGCRRCPVRRVCGGGYYPHRYKAGSGFANPSVYSADLRFLIEHIAVRLRRDVAKVKGQPWAATIA